MIDKLHHDGRWVVDEEAKADLIFNHFNSILDDYEECSHGLDFNALGVPTLHASAIDHYFSEDEVWAVISAKPPDKVSCPDDVSTLFYQTAWPLIKQDVMAAFHSFWSLDF
jgi:hypothetical protein